MKLNRNQLLTLLALFLMAASLLLTLVVVPLNSAMSMTLVLHSLPISTTITRWRTYPAGFFHEEVRVIEQNVYDISVFVKDHE